MGNYHCEYKKSLVDKVLSDRSKSVDEFAVEFGVSRASLFRWVRQYGLEGAGLVKRVPSPEKWSVAQKLRVLLEVQNLREQELGEYLRNRGLYYAHIIEWKADILDQVKNSKNNELPQSKSIYLRKIRELEKELKLKEKALKEATALLALKKKAELIWAEKEAEKSAESIEITAEALSKKRSKKGAG